MTSQQTSTRGRRRRVHDGWAWPTYDPPPEGLGRPTRAEDVIEMVEQMKKRWRRSQSPQRETD